MGPGTDKAYNFGAAGWTSVVGDWNPAVTGTKIGVYKDGVWYLDWNGNGAWDQGLIRCILSEPQAGHLL